MTPDTPPRPAFPTLAWLLVLMAALLPWGIFQIDYALREDVTWLVEAGQRLLNGGRYVTDVFEVNPPLSILLYLPLAISTDISHSSLPYAFFIYIIALTTIFACLTNAVIKRYEFLNGQERAVFIAGYVLACTALPLWVEFGQREQIIFMGILPMILLQIGMTFSPTVKRGPEFWPVMVLGSVAMLIKPHYGVFAAVIMLLRMIRQRRVSVMFDRDFIVLEALTVLYVIGTIILIPDYVFEYLPDVVTFYAGFGSFVAVAHKAIPYLVIFAMLSAAAYAIPMNLRVKKTLWLMIACGVLCLIPYAVQMKGFSYHIYPAKGFAFCALALVVCGIFSTRARLAASPLYAVLALIALCYVIHPLNTRMTTHDDYRHLPLTQKVMECNRPDCRFFMYVYGANFVYTTGYYAWQNHTSRFSDFWIPWGLYMEYEKLKEGTSRFSKEELDQYFIRHIRMLTEDISKGKPDQIFICQNCANDPFFDFLSIMNRDPSFADEWKNYREEETLTVDRGAYYKGTKAEASVPLTFKRYTRIAD